MPATSYNKRASGFEPSALRQNPSLSLRTSDTLKPLSAMREQEIN